jgi:hypothetical protein
VTRGMKVNVGRNSIGGWGMRRGGDMASPGFKGSSLIPAEPGRAACPKRRSSNANGLCGQKSAGSAEILRDFQRDTLSRHI